MVVLFGVLIVVGFVVCIVGIGVGGVEVVFIVFILVGWVYGFCFGLLFGMFMIGFFLLFWGGIGLWMLF